MVRQPCNAQTNDVAIVIGTACEIFQGLGTDSEISVMTSQAAQLTKLVDFLDRWRGALHLDPDLDVAAIPGLKRGEEVRQVWT